MERHAPNPDAINRRRYGPVMHVSTGRWVVIVTRECGRPPVLLGPRKATPVTSGDAQNEQHHPVSRSSSARMTAAMSIVVREP